MSLRTKIFLWLLPVTVAMFAFIDSYYFASKKALEQQLELTAELALETGATNLNHQLTLYQQEFELLARLMGDCILDAPQPHIEQQLSLALRHTRGFSSVVVTDTAGLARYMEWGGNQGNRFVLPQSIDGLPFISADQFAILKQRFSQWKSKLDPVTRDLNKLLLQQSVLNDRGEKNSEHYHQLQTRLAKLQKFVATAPALVDFSGHQQVQWMGLPFGGDTYQFIRPVLNCSDEVDGYLVAFLDRSKIEDELYRVRDKLLEKGTLQIDVALLNVEQSSLFTASRYLPAFGYRDIDNAYGRSSLVPFATPGLLLGTPVIDANFIDHALQHESGHELCAALLDVDDPARYETQTRLLLYIHGNEFASLNRELLEEVAYVAAMSLVMILLLIFLLANYISAPLVRLTAGVKQLAEGGAVLPAEIKRNDEIGVLVNSFEKMAYELKDKERQLVALATRDPLTDCLNRRAFSEVADQEFQRANRSGSPISLLLMDIDLFKSVNDRYGHNIGDIVLRNFSLLVKDILRSSDQLGRFGGEEFIVVLPDIDLAAGVIIAERIRLAISKQELLTGDGKIVSITVSIGICEWQDDQSLIEVIQHADNNLYQAKSLGRNRVESSSSVERSLLPPSKCADSERTTS
ncbi:MAG: GGDEF domain-containing protein [Motiliproteus sp.]